MQQLSSEADALATQLTAANPQIATAQAEWEKKFASPVTWTPLEDATITASEGTQFTQLEDGSFLARVVSPERDTYTVVGTTHLPSITAIRLDAIPDESLPGKGPGRNADGNFVLSHFTVTLAPKSDPAKAKPVMLRDAIADLEQEGYPVINAIKPKPGKGWAMYPHKGVANAAVFFVTGPAGDAGGAILTFTLDQQFSQQHTLGRFKISVTGDEEIRAKAAIPQKIQTILGTPADRRSAEDTAQLASFYQSVDPQNAADHARLEAIRGIISAPIGDRAA